MGNVVKDYIMGVFTSTSQTKDVHDLGNERRVTDFQNVALVAKINFSEYIAAVKQMHPDKVSGPDGLNPAFFKHFWSILGREVFVCCREWLRSGPFPANLNDTNVVLIRKKEDACCMRDLHPITLCNVSTKF